MSCEMMITSSAAPTNTQSSRSSVKPNWGDGWVRVKGGGSVEECGCELTERDRSQKESAHDSEREGKQKQDESSGGNEREVSQMIVREAAEVGRSASTSGEQDALAEQ